MQNRTVSCWGWNLYGEVGDGSASEQDSPVATGVTGAIDISMGLGFHSCAALSAGGVKCWGEDDNGECGDGVFNTEDDSPVSVSTMTTALGVQLGSDHSCAVVSGGTVKCWGYNGDGELGDGEDGEQERARRGKPTNVIAVAGGGAHTCARSLDR